jgi:hypothetical protein
VRDLSLDDLQPIAGDAAMNLIRRCADGSLRMSSDRWRLAEVSAEVVVFHSVGGDALGRQVHELAVSEIERMTWDRLPKQQSRSQLRFHLCGGDLWTFSGALSEPP